jgi:NADH-quinone oxidoreductase subunit L
MVNASAAYWIPFLPLISALLIFTFGRWLPWKGAILGVLAAAGSFFLSVDLLLQFTDGTLKASTEFPWPWFSAGGYPFEWGILLDGPSITMCLMVSFVSFAVQIYSIGYMAESPRLKRFFVYLSLFTFSMLGLVLANNYLQFFVGWEVMGACSYFLISFEFERTSAGLAGNKAFLTTRIGDLGLYAALLSMFLLLGTFNMAQIEQQVREGALTPHVVGILALLLFAATVGKSAQLPLHVWLPDAMEGPTPVSALIHAATMVAAGVYLAARGYGLFLAAPNALQIVAWTGGITAFVAATMAITANDLKRVLAYSTMSQLGYMIMGLGVLGYSAALFHLTTHAFFKALLFLAAGSVLHAVHTNDLWKMGSLSKQMLITTITFFCGYIALIGIPGTSGYFSKDLILAAAFTNCRPLFILGCVTVFLTAFYMTRAFSLVFLGEPRERDRFAHAQESPWIMTVPLIFLAVPAVGLGFFMDSQGLVAKLFPAPGKAMAGAASIARYVVVGAALSGMATGVFFYTQRLGRVAAIASALNPLYKLVVRRYFFDEFYDRVFIQPLGWLAKALDRFDLVVLDGVFIEGFGRALKWVLRLDREPEAPTTVGGLGTFARGLRSGMAQNYLLAITVGVVFLMLWRVF